MGMWNYAFRVGRGIVFPAAERVVPHSHHFLEDVIKEALYVQALVMHLMCPYRASGEIRHAHSTRDSVDLPQILRPCKCAPRTSISLYLSSLLNS